MYSYNNKTVSDQFVQCFSLGFKQGNSSSQRGCGGNAGQLWPGVLPHEVLHGPYERLQERGPGVCKQQAGQNQGGPLHGCCGNCGDHFPHAHRSVHYAHLFLSI